MSQLLFPTPDSQQPQVVSQEDLEGLNRPAVESLTQDDRIMRLVISGAIGTLIGVVEAVIISNSLVEIATTKGFSIVFGIALLLLAAVLGWRVWVSHQGGFTSKAALLFLSLMVFVCGILCFVVDSRQVVNKSSAKKAPYFAFISGALAFALTFAFSEFINLGLCDICCPRTYTIHPAFISRIQLYIVLLAGILLGIILGMMFGIMGVEDDTSASHSKLVKMLLYGMIPGFLVGSVVGVGVEFIRDRVPNDTYVPLPTESAHSRGASGYEDI